MHLNFNAVRYNGLAQKFHEVLLRSLERLRIVGLITFVISLCDVLFLELSLVYTSLGFIQLSLSTYTLCFVLTLHFQQQVSVLYTHSVEFNQSIETCSKPSRYQTSCQNYIIKNSLVYRTKIYSFFTIALLQLLQFRKHLNVVL